MSHRLRHHLRQHLVTAVVMIGLIGRPCRAATSGEVQRAIDGAIAFLHTQQNAAGTWEEAVSPLPGTTAYSPGGGQWGGMTALATYSLLAAGERAGDRRLAGAIQFLKAAPIKGVYALGMRAQVWSYLPRDAAVRAGMARDGALLLAGMKTQGEGRGMYGYLAGGVAADSQHVFDHSVSQFAVLGMWSLEEAGLETPDQYWASVDAAWRRQQLSDGGWSYYPQPQGVYPETVSMTAAGVATLFLSDDYLRAASGLQCRDNLADLDIDRGLDWIGGHFDTVFTAPNRACYALYAVERIGAAAGRKMLGGADWWGRGADFLIDHQMASGAWDQGDGTIADTAFGLLFLIRGRAPVVMNKLDYSAATIGAAWDRRPRDAAHVTRWISRTIEASRPLNWQVVNLAGKPEEWHDAPILLICGREALKFSGEQEGKLKQFVEEGGLILCNADCSHAEPFVRSVEEMGRRMFGGEFRPLPGDHAIYTAEEFHRNTWHDAPGVLGLSNEARELMILVPEADVAAAWQANSAVLRPEAFELAANIFLYAVDKENLRFKGESYLVKADGAAGASRAIKIARLDYGKGFDPEPGGWRRLAAVMHNRDGVDLEVAAVGVGDGSLAGGGYAVAHLTGTGVFELSAAARGEIRRFVEGGGTLIVDSAGGARGFAESARVELGEMFGDGAGELDKPLAIDQPFYSGANPRVYLRDVEYRPFARTVLADVKGPRLRGIRVGGRIGVFFSAEDLSCGLVGEPMDGIVGYTPELATRLMERMILVNAQ